MKSVELELQKRLLIVEDAENGTYFAPRSVGYHIEKEGEIWKLICKGSELTEEITDDLVHGFDLGYFVDYNHHNPRAYKLTAMGSFISAIESKGYYWGKNDLTDSILAPDIDEWQDAQSKTFNPDKTIIFEIL